MIVTLPSTNNSACEHAPQAAARVEIARRHQSSRITPALAAQATSPPYQQAAPLTKRTFAGITLYKGKAAVAFKVIRPTWTQTGDSSYAMKREGVMLLEFAPIQGGSSGTGVGDRRYDWDNKQTIALSHWELGNFLAQKEGEAVPRIFHDPNMGSNLAGTVTKELQFAPMPNSSPPVYYINLTVTEKNGPTTKLGCPVTPGELATIKSIIQFIMPHITGFDAIFQDEQEVYGDYNAPVPVPDGPPPF
ncbi:hypothetical protein WJX72_006298 [[Myrmecia] bisecta]|uniref:Uncharacterized protein n=1 Tax=[Myrmecia] bisecta TaxID=41462 RepID=A0AAW1R834_9CHLO